MTCSALSKYFAVGTGDYHYSDIKVARPSSATGSSSSNSSSGSPPYTQAYNTTGWATPLYQVMASGLTNSTARPQAGCQGYRRWIG